jgi:hypothetical protein
VQLSNLLYSTAFNGLLKVFGEASYFGSGAGPKHIYGSYTLIYFRVIIYSQDTMRHIELIDGKVNILKV